MMVRPDIRAAFPAGTADEPDFQIGQPGIIGPLVSADRRRVAALVIRAINQETAHAGGVSARLILVGRAMPTLKRGLMGTQFAPW
jgi:hypothetical protein